MVDMVLRRIVLIAVVGVAIAASAYAYLSWTTPQAGTPASGQAQAPAAGPAGAPAGAGGRPGGGGGRVTAVAVIEIGTRRFADVIEAIGTARANESVTLTAKTTETVKAIGFEDGATVEAGAIVVELTSAEQAAQLQAARATLQDAESQFARVRDLTAQGTATQARLDTQRASRDTAAARVRELEARLSDNIIRAPFAGVLGLRQVSVGTLVRPGDVITTLDDIAVIKLDFSVPEIFLGSLSAGQKVEARAAAFPGEVFTGTVAAVDTRVDPVSRSVTVRATVPNPDARLRPGMLLAVQLIRAEREALSVPELALVPLEDRQYVFVITPDSKAERRQVTIGTRIPGFVEITGGLSAGERVVSEGTNRVQPGMTVQVAPPAGAVPAAAPVSGQAQPQAPAAAAPAVPAEGQGQPQGTRRSGS